MTFFKPSKRYKQIYMGFFLIKIHASQVLNFVLYSETILSILLTFKTMVDYINHVWCVLCGTVLNHKWYIKWLYQTVCVYQIHVTLSYYYRWGNWAKSKDDFEY